MPDDARIGQAQSQRTDLNVGTKSGFEWENNTAGDWDLIKKPNKRICTVHRRLQTYTTYECSALRRP